MEIKWSIISKSETIIISVELSVNLSIIRLIVPALNETMVISSIHVVRVDFKTFSTKKNLNTFSDMYLDTNTS